MKSISQSTKQEGVITVLFLFVVAFILGAISFSFYLAQLVEKRVSSMAATDAAVYGLASHSAQGLNYISANNLAIAAAVHIGGATQIFADQIIINATIVLADKKDIRGISSESKKNYKAIYDIMGILTSVYFTSAKGMSRLNSNLAKFYPYTGLPRAFQIGLANQPGAVVIPFRSQPGGITDPAGVKKGFKQRIKDVLSNSVKLDFGYQGLKSLNAKQTFCLSFIAGKAMGSKEQNEIGNWFMGTGIPALSEVANSIGATTKFLNKIMAFIGLKKIGFAACGFGEDSSVPPAKTISEGRKVSMLIQTVLKGPLSGRDSVYPPQSKKDVVSCSDSFCLKARRNVQSLVNEVNTVAPCGTDVNQANAELNLETSTTGQSVFTQFRITSKPPANGLCIAADQSKGFRTVEVTVDGNQKKTVQLQAVKSICHGEILFKWSAYAGIDSFVNNPIEPWIDPNQDKLCPDFVATKGLDVELRFDSNLELSLNRPFLKPILDKVAFDENTEPQYQPPNGTFNEIIKYMSCANDRKQPACDNPDGSFGLAPYKFDPGLLEDLKWLCPVRDVFLLGDDASYIDFSYNNNIKDWHNKRILNEIDCTAYEAYKAHTPPVDNVNNQNQQENFCASSPFMCWAKNWSKVDDKNQEDLAFVIPDPSSLSGSGEPLLDLGLQYNVLMLSPLYVDAALRDGSTAGSTCPNGLEVKAHLDPTDSGSNEITICDLRPMVGLIEKMFGTPEEEKNHAAQALIGGSGGADANLAAGGALRTFADDVSGLRTMVSISQAKVTYHQGATAANPQAPDPVSPIKAYRMFWPSWRPQLVPSRFFTGVFGPALGVFLED